MCVCVCVCVCVCDARVEGPMLQGVRCCWSRDVVEGSEKAWNIKSLIYRDKAFQLYSVSTGE